MNIMINTVKKHLKTVVILIYLSSSIPALAQDENVRYITDVLYVPLRAGAGNDYRIINSKLKSGNKLTIIEGQQGDAWLRVKTESGVEGWFPSQYLTTRPSNRDRLSQTLRKVSELEKENAKLRNNARELLDTNQSLNQEASSVSTDKEKMERELQKIKSLASDSINLEKSYRELLEDHELLQTDIEALTFENDKLKSDKRLSFMLYGAGLILSGIFLAIIIPAITPKKRYSDWS